MAAEHEGTPYPESCHWLPRTWVKSLDTSSPLVVFEKRNELRRECLGHLQLGQRLVQSMMSSLIWLFWHNYPSMMGVGDSQVTEKLVMQ